MKKISKMKVFKKIIENLNLEDCRFLESENGYIYVTHECECGHCDCDHCTGKESKHIIVGHLNFKNNKIERV
jgi:hypothetical protein